MFLSTGARFCRQELSWKLCQPRFVDKHNVDRNNVLWAGAMICLPEQSWRREAAWEMAWEAAKAAWEAAKAA